MSSTPTRTRPLAGRTGMSLRAAASCFSARDRQGPRDAHDAQERLPCADTHEPPSTSASEGYPRSSPTARATQPRQRCRRPLGRSSGDAARSSGGSPLGCGRTRSCSSAMASSDSTCSCLRLADANEDPRRKRDPQLPGGLDGRQPLRRMLGRRARMDGVHQALGDRLQHQALGRGDLAQALARSSRVEHADVRVRQDAALQARARRPRRRRR